MKRPKTVRGWGSAPDPAGGAYDAPPDSLVSLLGWGGDTPSPFLSIRRLFCLHAVVRRL